MTDANIVQVVWSLTSMIRSDCSDVDHTRAVPASVIERLRSAGVFRMLAPREIGGAETDPLALFSMSWKRPRLRWLGRLGGHDRWMLRHFRWPPLAEARRDLRRPVDNQRGCIPA